jgi:low affinity Fe/Cu permease
MNRLFQHIAERTALLVGTPWAFISAVIVIVAWAVSGPLFGYSDTWQLVVNTGTTIVTFLIVFLIQEPFFLPGTSHQVWKAPDSAAIFGSDPSNAFYLSPPKADAK